jgi:hypothetical protein
MGIFANLFGSKKLTINDADFGEIESSFAKGNEVVWKIHKKYFNTNIDILIGGNKDGIDENQKQILLSAFNNEPQIKSESEKALQQEFENAEMEFESIEKHFDMKGISVHASGFEISFQDKNDPYYYFNVHFENNQSTGVSIDG